MKLLSSAIISNILSLLDACYSTRHIARQVGVSVGSVSNICSQHRPDLPKSKRGRPSKISDTTLRHAIRLISTGKVDTAVQASKALQNTSSGSFSDDTMRRALKSVSMKSTVKRKCPLLSARHRRAHLDFNLAHQYWTEQDWDEVVWTDETKINRLGSDGRKWTWKKPGEPLNDRLVEGTLKFGGGSLMMWGCMTLKGCRYATKIDGKMDAELYVSILEDELMQSLAFWKKKVKDVVFQQDNDPKHTSKKAKNWLEDHHFKVMVWPAQSPDLNPIEHLWNHLKRKLGEYDTPPKGEGEHWRRVEKEWNEIPDSVCRNLVASMPRRIEAVIKAKGGYTKY